MVNAAMFVLAATLLSVADDSAGFFFREPGASITDEDTVINTNDSGYVWGMASSANKTGSTMNKAMDLPNLALKKPTSQSSVNMGRTSDLAVDGNHSTIEHEGSCSHVATSYSPSLDWWQVDLQQTYLVLTVSITNRGDCCHRRLTNFTAEIHTSDPMASTNSGLQLCYWHEGTVGKGLTVDLPCAINTIGRYVRIVKYSSGYKPLTLCEVEVRGSPLHRTSGDSAAEFMRHIKGARARDYIIASHDNIGKFDCAIMCLRKATCSAFNSKAPSMGVVSCELLAAALDPLKNESWNVYSISRLSIRVNELKT